MIIMGFWTVPMLANLTSTSLDHRHEFVMTILLAVAGAGRGADAETVGHILASATTANPTSYGDTATTMDRAFAFLIDYRDTETSPRRYRAADAAAAALRSAGALDQRPAFVA